MKALAGNEDPSNPSLNSTMYKSVAISLLYYRFRCLCQILKAIDYLCLSIVTSYRPLYHPLPRFLHFQLYADDSDPLIFASELSYYF